jgi:hypothetical protein
MAALTNVSQPFRKARAVNQTSATFVAKIPTGTEPTGDAGTATGASVIDLAAALGGESPRSVLIVPYGVGSNNNTMSIQVIGWKLIGTDPLTWLWVPVNLLEVLVTLSSTIPGVAGRQVVATELFADTIAIVTGNANVSVDVNSPADDTVASILLNLKGCQKLELSFETGSSATSCNALLALV